MRKVNGNSKRRRLRTDVVGVMNETTIESIARKTTIIYGKGQIEYDHCTVVR